MWHLLVNSDHPPPPRSIPLTIYPPSEKTPYRPHLPPTLLPTLVLHSLISPTITSPLSCAAYHLLPCVSHSMSPPPVLFLSPLHLPQQPPLCLHVIFPWHITSIPSNINACILMPTLSQSPLRYRVLPPGHRALDVVC
jgi:hypothetical protein